MHLKFIKYSFIGAFVFLLICLENKINTTMKPWGNLLYFLHPVLSIFLKKKKHFHLKQHLILIKILNTCEKNLTHLASRRKRLIL